MRGIDEMQARFEKRDSAHVAQVVEHVLGKDEVSGSSPLVSSRKCRTEKERGETAGRSDGLGSMVVQRG